MFILINNFFSVHKTSSTVVVWHVECLWFVLYHRVSQPENNENNAL